MAAQWQENRLVGRTRFGACTILLLLSFTASGFSATTTLRPITDRDRVLVVAPHPDDESLGAGGIIQRAVAAHARLRVVFLTNGDNNVWAQRFIEHRFYVSAADKARWGARRDKEAMRALARLGAPAGSAVFLDFHDCSTTGLLMADDKAFVGAIDSDIVRWQPTILVLPSPDDLHPDHNTAYVVTHLEYHRLGAAPPTLELDYLVHTEGTPFEPDSIALPLTAQERQTQLEAILCHATQMALGRKRFSAYAKDVETFYPVQPPAALAPHHPLCETSVEHGKLHLAICREKIGGLRGATVDVALETLRGEPVRLEVPVPADSLDVAVTDTLTGQPAGMATVRYSADRIRIDIPVGTALLRMAFVKLDWRPVFFDTAGWRATPVNAQGLVSPAGTAR